MSGDGIAFDNVSVTYAGGHTALDGVTLGIPAGQMVAVVGLSGAGKSTLIRTINGLVPVTSGTVTVGDRAVNNLSSKGLRDLRGDVGMIFQGFNLAKRTSVLNNVMMGRLHSSPMWRTLLGAWSAEDTELGMQALERVEIVGKAYAKASSLSGGQQQRVAIAGHWHSNRE